jgi:hypothetical protein
MVEENRVPYVYTEFGEGVTVQFLWIRKMNQ